MPGVDLATFLARLRSGDAAGVEQLLSQYEPFIRRAIRLRLVDGRLRHVLDTADILQSLLLDFLTQQPRSLAEQGDLRSYLTRAVRNKILTRARKERARIGELGNDYDRVSTEPSADALVEARDTIRTIRNRLHEPERQLLDLVGQGLTWPVIAHQLGGRPATLRVRLSRAIAGVLADLKNNEDRHAC